MNTPQIILATLAIFTTLQASSQEVLSNKSQKISVDFAENEPSKLVITKPVFGEGRITDFSPTYGDYMTIEGFARDEDGLRQLLINGIQVSFDEGGFFEYDFKLSNGLNTITFDMFDAKNATTSKEYQINRVASNLSFNETVTGKYYALIVGINQYQDPDITDLDRPAKDAAAMYQAITSRYTFEKENISMLNDPTYEELIEALDNMSDQITEDDNFLVFYAGHGWWDEDKKLGYWLPSDAKKSNTAFWLPNSRISDYIGSIKSKHTLLIADACFSGSIFKTRAAFADAQPAINRLYQMNSRKAMTSGTLKEVPDESVFIRYLLKRLGDNQDKYMSSEKLFTSFRMAVMNNSENVPQYGTVQNVGDEGGDFIFILRQ